MKHLQCIPNEIVSPEQRQRLYNFDQNSAAILASKRYDIAVHVDAQMIARNYQELTRVIDNLAAAYLAVSRERDQYKGVCELAKDEDFWKALQLLEHTQA